ncbi:MAG: HD domain-containing protein [bacterium]|nr:HD domain-containing protein [bacterium]
MSPDGTTSIREPLYKLLAHVPHAYHPMIGQAYLLANASHEGQNRDAGQPYITHPIAVALILASEFGFAQDVDMITAALLHDAVEDSALSQEDILPTFGTKVADLIRGVTKVEGSHTRSRSARRTATLQRLFAAAQEDPRVLILKLADRIHNMRSIAGIRDEKRRRRIAQETLDVYAPLSHLLGMDRIRRELEDRSFGCLEPKIYNQLIHLLDKGPPKAFLASQEYIKSAMVECGIRARLRLHTKSLRSIYRKTGYVRKVPDSIKNIYDRYSVKVIVSNRDACYRTLGVIHSQFAPLMEGLKDFIALPKRNGYQALHTIVIDAGMRFEIHIQTPSMYRMGELGVATLRGDRLQEERRGRWLQELSEWHEHAGPSDRFLDEVKRILFVQEMAVFTPKDDPIVLPEGATLADFAFAVHTDLGLHCTGGRVNGKPASRFTVLKWGDTVEVKTSPTQQPKRSWLRYAKTYRARRLIRRNLSRTDTSDERMLE